MQFYLNAPNPGVFHLVHTQRPENLDVWTGIFGGRVVGQFFQHSFDQGPFEVFEITELSMI